MNEKLRKSLGTKLSRLARYWPFLLSQLAFAIFGATSVLLEEMIGSNAINNAVEFLFIGVLYAIAA